MIVPLRLSRHFPIIVATIDGLDVPLVLDSGDQSTVALQQSVLDKIKAVPTSESTQLQFAKGPTVKSAKFRIPRLQIGQTVFTDVIGRLDVHDPSYQATDVGQKGFFGTGLLKPYEVVLDYRNRTMTLIPRESSEGPSESCRGTAVPFASKEAPGEPVTEVDTDLGKFLAWWDTGSPISAISKRFVEGARKLIIGHPHSASTDISSLITEGEAQRVESWIREAVDAGALGQTLQRIGRELRRLPGWRSSHCSTSRCSLPRR